MQTIAVEPGGSGAMPPTAPDLAIRNVLNARRFTLEVECDGTSDGGAV
ncbi:MAG TPA: hypothetical protein VGD94_15735 [Vicinamibacterales bacterium]